MPSAPLPVPSDNVTLAGVRGGRPGGLPVVFLHAGVADRRSWRGVFDLPDGDGFAPVGYRRRGRRGAPPRGGGGSPALGPGGGGGAGRAPRGRPPRRTPGGP